MIRSVFSLYIPVVLLHVRNFLHYWQRVCLRVEHPPVQRDHTVITKQQVKVLQGLGQEEALLHIVLGRVCLKHIPQTDIASINTAVLLQCLLMGVRERGGRQRRKNGNCMPLHCPHSTGSKQRAKQFTLERPVISPLQVSIYRIFIPLHHHIVTTYSPPHTCTASQPHSLYFGS